MNVPSSVASLRHRRGFSLLEVMVAVALLGIAMVAIHHAQALGIRGMARSKNLTLATMLAWEKMNDFLINIHDDFPPAGEERTGDFDKPYEQYHWVLRVENNTNVPEIYRDMIPMVQLTVSWDTEETKTTKIGSTLGEKQRGRKVEICTYVARLQ